MLFEDTFGMENRYFYPGSLFNILNHTIIGSNSNYNFHIRMIVIEFISIRSILIIDV